MSDPVWVVLAAGGRGVRASLPVPKQFQEFGGKTVLELAVLNLARMPEVAGIAVAMPPEPLDPKTEALMAEAKSRLHGPAATRVEVRFVDGGATRQESVYNALRVVPEDVPWIAVHDASRPFCSEEVFRKVVDAARRHGAAICAVRPTDTVKIVGRDGRRDTAGPSAGGREGTTERVVEGTLDRDRVVCAQTPQVFSADLLRRAHEDAGRYRVAATDDSELVEKLGHEVAVVEGERANVKLTYPEDFAFAKSLAADEAPDRDTPDRQEPERREPARGTSAVGLGFDIHPLVPGRRCVIGGVDIPSEKGPVGHSDADVLCHAVMDSVLGALGRGDIGQWFPDDDPRYEGASSIGLMTDMWQALKAEAEVANINAVVVAEAPRISSHAQSIRDNIAKALGCSAESVSIKATTSEKIGVIGRGEAIAALCVVSIRRLEGR